MGGVEVLNNKWSKGRNRLLEVPNKGATMAASSASVLSTGSVPSIPSKSRDRKLASRVKTASIVNHIYAAQAPHAPKANRQGPKEEMKEWSTVRAWISALFMFALASSGIVIAASVAEVRVWQPK
eukprot:6448988-Prymnesium_polylepis.2